MLYKSHRYCCYMNKTETRRILECNMLEYLFASFMFMHSAGKESN